MDQVQKFQQYEERMAKLEASNAQIQETLAVMSANLERSIALLGVQPSLIASNPTMPTGTLIPSYFPIPTPNAEAASLAITGFPHQTLSAAFGLPNQTLPTSYTFLKSANHEGTSSLKTFTSPLVFMENEHNHRSREMIEHEIREGRIEDPRKKGRLEDPSPRDATTFALYPARYPQSVKHAPQLAGPRSQSVQQSLTTRQGNRVEKRRREPRKFTPLPMSLVDLYRQALARNLIGPEIFKVDSKLARNDPHSKCEFHMGAAGHATEDCMRLKHKIQDLIDHKLLVLNPAPSAKISHLSTHKRQACSKMPDSETCVPNELHSLTTEVIRTINRNGPTIDSPRIVLSNKTTHVNTHSLRYE